MRRLLTTIITTLVLASALAPATAQSGLEIKPGKLPRGADVAGPHLDGTTIVDGDTRIAVKTPRLLLLGKWENVYVATTGDRAWGNPRLVKVTKSGTVKVLRKFIDPFNAKLDPESGQVAYSFGDEIQKPTLAIYDLTLKDEIAARAFSSPPTLVAFDQGLIVTSFYATPFRTITWDTVSDEVVRVNRKMANFASVAHDLLGYYSKDPYQGGCQVLARLSDPTDRLWTNCDERIEAVSPDGKRMATIPLLSDGIGPADVLLRKLTGARLAHYTVDYYFGEISWETPQSLLLEAHGKTQSALVRCVVTVCDRATDLTPTEVLRPLAG